MFKPGDIVIYTSDKYPKVAKKGTPFLVVDIREEDDGISTPVKRYKDYKYGAWAERFFKNDDYVYLHNSNIILSNIRKKEIIEKNLGRVDEEI